MRHDFEPVNQGIEGIWNYGKRRCKNCKKTQTKQSEQEWMKVTGYKWYPLIGRCKGEKK